VHSNRLLKKPVEEHSSGARSSTIQAEGEFIPVGLQVVGANRPLMGAHQPPFCESDDPVHSWEHLVRIFAGGLDGGALVGVIGPSGTWVGCQFVGMDRGTSLNISQEKGSQSARFSVGDNLNPAPAESFGLHLFTRHRDESLASSPATTLPGPNAANHRHRRTADQARRDPWRSGSGEASPRQSGRSPIQEGDGGSWRTHRSAAPSCAKRPQTIP
jgi:hypothetical protein